jgi:Tol biopolymer transport system component
MLLSLSVSLVALSFQGREVLVNEPFPLVPVEDVAEIAYSVDGTRLAYWVREADRTYTLYGRAADGSGPATALANLPDQHFGPRFMAGGTRVYYGSLEREGTRAFSVPFDGSAAPIEPIGQRVRGVMLTHDEARLIYLDDSISHGRFDLLSVPIGGGSPILLNTVLPGGDVTAFELTTDGTRTVYWSSATTGAGIYAAQVTASGTAVLLSAGVTSPQTDLVITRDNQHVVFRGSLPGSPRVELLIAPIDGSVAPLRLSEGVGANSVSVEEGFQVSPDGAWVAFRADRFVAGKFELFAAPTDGSAPPHPLGPALANTADVQPGFRITSDSRRVVWRADATVVTRLDLFSAPIDGSAAAIQLAGAATSDEDVNALLLFSLDGARLAFLSGVTGTFQRLFSVPVDGSSAPAQLDDHLSETLSQPSLTYDGARMVYRRFVGDEQELRVARLDGSGAPLKLAFGDHLADFTVGPDARVAFTVDQDQDGADELFTRPLDGSQPALQVSQAFVASAQGGNVYEHRVGRERVLYIADQDASGITGLYSAPWRSPNLRIRISDTTLGPIDVVEAGEVEFAADETRAVFRGWIADRESLFSASVARTEDPIVLDLGAQPFAEISSYRISPNDRAAIFLSDQDADEVFELYAAPLTFQGFPRKLSGALVQGGDVQPGYQVTPDGTRVVYVADGKTDEVFELYSTDGSGNVLVLSGTPLANRDVQTDVLISPDSTRVFFRGDLDVDNRMELYSVPIDGSSTPIKISGPSISGSNVLPGFRVTPDNVHVLFAGDQLVDQEVRLFRANSDGFGPILLLSSTLPTYDVSDILIDPTGTRAVFFAAYFFTVHQAIFSVPISGSSPPIQLSHNPPNLGFVADLAYIGETPGFQITPDGTRVLYIVDPFSSGVSSLSVVPIDGSAPATRLNPATAGQDALAFLVDPTSRWAIYLTGFATGYDLHRVPLDLSQPATQVNLDTNGRVGYDFRFSPDGSSILYRFDVLSDAKNDLYAVLPNLGPKGAPAPSPTRTVTRSP